ncbi:AT-hook motif nuclear-localized protein 5-like [Bidens hawaiensis]|uniref:AT-hook motif nuclear-localized protein 5-like n=1 Tax=Bidens hawaiensis TaxID=980011 RepID=UPI00404ABE60
MDVREGMSSFYLNRGVSGSDPHSGSGPPGFNNMRVGPIGSSYPVEHNPSPNFPHDMNLSGGGGGGSGGSETIVKKKRGRPRKYADGLHMALALVPAPSAGGSPGLGTPVDKKNRGRPPGSGRKQRLANVGEWMSASAGLAFTPHIIHVGIGEDIAAKIQSFAQQRPRALCIMSANGSVSAVQLRQFASSGGAVTYEGRFEILSLSGSYLLPESGALNHRTGGLSISICSPDGHVIGGAIGGRLIASSLVQVVACSFLYGGNNSKKTKTDTPSAEEKSPRVQLNETSPVPSQAIAWPQDSWAEPRNSHTEIDLTRG